MEVEAARQILKAALAALDNGEMTTLICAFGTPEGMTAITEGQPMEMIFMLRSLAFTTEHSMFGGSAQPHREDFQ